MRSLRVLLIAILLGASLSCQAAVTYKGLLKQSTDALAAGRLEQAFLLASGAIKLEPGQWEAKAVAATSLGAAGNHLDAVRFWQSALETAPEPKQASLLSALQKEQVLAEKQRHELGVPDSAMQMPF